MKTINWLVVGTGDIATKRVIPAIIAEPRSRLKAVCDTVKERAEAAAVGTGAAIYTELAQALQSPQVDAVYLCTPIFLHVPQAIQALQAGKHVLIEKPLAVDYQQTRALTAAAKATDRRCGVAYFRRFSPKYVMAKKMLEAGQFGQVILIRMTYFSWFNPLPTDPKYWRVIPERSGGGPLSDMGTHMFDVLIGLLGLPERVFALAETLTHKYAVEDSCVAVMKMQNGAQVIASFNWNSKTWSHEFEIVGTEAKVKWMPYDGNSFVKTVGRDTQEIEAANHANVHYPLIEDFVSAVAEGRPPLITPDDAALTNRLLDAIYLSAREKREVILKEMDG